jgi:hypothetical protein
MLAWLMKTPFAIQQIEKWSYDYIKMDCAEDKCYGVLAVYILSLLSYETVSLTGCRYIAFASLFVSCTQF